MNKHSAHFQFTHNLYQSTVRDLRIVKEKIGEIIVSGTAYLDDRHPVTQPFLRYSADIDFCYYNGTDVKPLLVWAGEMDTIEEEAVRKAALLFDLKTAA